MKTNSVILTSSCVTWELFELKGFQWGLQKQPVDFESVVTCPALTVERLIFWSQTPQSPWVLYNGSCQLWEILVSVFPSLSVCLVLFKNCLWDLHFWCLCKFSLIILYSVFEGTWTEDGFNAQISYFGTCHLFLSVLASLACVLSIPWSCRDFSSLHQGFFLSWVLCCIKKEGGFFYVCFSLIFCCKSSLFWMDEVLSCSPCRWPLMEEIWPHLVLSQGDRS